MKTAAVFFLAAACVAQAAPPDLWPVEVKAPQPAELQKQCAVLNAASLPAELKRAAQFQKTFLRILASGESKVQPLDSPWVSELRAFIAADREADPVAHGIAEVSRAWLARAEMQQIDAVLRQYYRQNVRFPEQFSVIEASLPEAVRLDPWGQPWVYRTCAPKGLDRLIDQRYLLGHACFPDLGLPSHRQSAIPQWNLALRNLGDKRTLEIRTGSTTATLQPGGKTGIYTLLYLGENWALLAGPDQLFAVTF